MSCGASEIHIAEQIGEFVKWASGAQLQWENLNPYQTLKLTAATKGAVSLDAIAQVFGRNKQQIHDWDTNSSGFSLRHIFEIAFEFGLPLRDLIEGRCCALRQARPVPVIRHKKRPAAKVDPKVLAQQLAALQPGTYPNIHATAKALGIGIIRLKKERPDLFEGRRVTRKETTVKRRSDAMDAFVSEARAVIEKLKGDGLGVNRNNVRDRLNRKGALADPGYRSKLQQLLVEAHRENAPHAAAS